MGRDTSVGGQSRNYIAKLNKTTGAADVAWDPDANQFVNSMDTDGTYLYIGGVFTDLGGTIRNYIAKINCATGAVEAWDPNANNRVTELKLIGGDLYVTGWFTTIGGGTIANFVKLNTSTGLVDASWDPAPNGIVYTFTSDGTHLFVGGAFTEIGGLTKNHIAKVDFTTGAAEPYYDPNTDHTVRAIYIDGDASYIGGLFSQMGGETHYGLAACDKFGTPPAPPPVLQSIETSVDGYSLLMTFDSDMAAPVDGAALQGAFTINNITGGPLVNAVSQPSPKVIELAMSVQILPGDDDGTLDYVIPVSDQLVSNAGSDCPALTDEPIVNNVVIPEIVSVETNTDGTKLIVTFSVDMAAPVAGIQSAFSLSNITDNPVVDDVSQLSAKVFELTLSVQMQYGDNDGILTYTIPGTNNIQSTQLVDLHTTTNIDITNNVMPPGIESIKTNNKGNLIYITFSQGMENPAGTLENYFTLNGINMPSIVDIYMMQGSTNTFVVELSTFLLYGQTLSIQYTLPGSVNDYIKSLSGVHMIAFEYTVQNKVPKAPVIVSASIREGSQTLILVFDKAMEDPGLVVNSFAVDILGNSPNPPLEGYYIDSKKPYIVAYKLTNVVGEQATGGTVTYIEAIGNEYFSVDGARLANNTVANITIRPEVPLSNWGIVFSVLFIIGLIVLIKQ